MKKKKGLTIKINLSNRWLYTLIAFGILLIIGVGVYALDTSQAWHGSNQIDFTGGFTVPEGDVTVDGILTANKVTADELCIGEDCKISLAETDPKISADAFNQENKGLLIIGAKSGYSCNTICSSHGLICRTGSYISGSISGFSCGTTNLYRNCWCE